MKLKHVLAPAIICMISFTSKAQIGKGSVWLGGSLGFNSVKNDATISSDNKKQSLMINPGIGIAVKENTIAGVDLLYSHATEKNADALYKNDRKTNSYGIGVFIRQYVPVINRLYIFGQGRIGYGNSTITDKLGGVDSKTKNWSTGLTFSPGVSFAVTNKIQLETSLNNLVNVQYAHSKSPSGAKSSTFSGGISVENGTPFSVGVRFLLNKKG